MEQEETPQQETVQPSQPEVSNPPVVSIGDWVITIFIASIPIVNLIMLFIWGFGDNTNRNKANWAKATLIWIAVMVVIYILIAIAFGAFFFSNMDRFDASL